MIQNRQELLVPAVRSTDRHPRWIIDKLRRHFMSSAKSGLIGIPIVFPLPSDQSDGWHDVRCHACHCHMASGRTVFLGDVNPLSRYEAWVYICSSCCDPALIDHLVVAIENVVELNLTGVGALIMIWGSFDNIPADMLM